MVQPLPEGAWAPLDMDGDPCCFDCQSAFTVMKHVGLNFEQARIAVGNDRQEQYRLPGAPMGLVQSGLVKPSKAGDFDKHIAWLAEVFNTEEEEVA
jgi:hypothetical protein